MQGIVRRPHQAQAKARSLYEQQGPRTRKSIVGHPGAFRLFAAWIQDGKV